LRIDKTQLNNVGDTETKGGGSVEIS